MRRPQSITCAVRRDVSHRSVSARASACARTAKSRYVIPGAKPRYAKAVGVWAASAAGARAARTRPENRMRPIYENEAGPGVARARLRCDPSRSDLADVLRLQPLRTLRHVELDRVTFREAPEPLGLDRREVDEHVRTRLLRDKAEALRVVEPLHLTLSHTLFILERMGALPRGHAAQPPRPGTGSNKNRETDGPRGAQTNR